MANVRERSLTSAAGADGPLTIDRDRFAADLEALGRFGWTDEGMQRTAFSPAHAEAGAWFLARGRDTGLRTAIDGAGNHSAALAAARPQARTLLLGSHLDSVPNGGRFDGASACCARSRSCARSPTPACACR